MSGSVRTFLSPDSMCHVMAPLLAFVYTSTVYICNQLLIEVKVNTTMQWVAIYLFNTCSFVLALFCIIGLLWICDAIILNPFELKEV